MAETGENRARAGEKGKKKLRILLRTFGWPYASAGRKGLSDLEL